MAGAVAGAVAGAAQVRPGREMRAGACGMVGAARGEVVEGFVMMQEEAVRAVGMRAGCGAAAAAEEARMLGVRAGVAAGAAEEGPGVVAAT